MRGRHQKGSTPIKCTDCDRAFYSNRKDSQYCPPCYRRRFAPKFDLSCQRCEKPFQSDQRFAYCRECYKLTIPSKVGNFVVHCEDLFVDGKRCKNFFETDVQGSRFCPDHCVGQNTKCKVCNKMFLAPKNPVKGDTYGQASTNCSNCIGKCIERCRYCKNEIVCPLSSRSPSCSVCDSVIFLLGGGSLNGLPNVKELIDERFMLKVTLRYAPFSPKRCQCHTCLEECSDDDEDVRKPNTIVLCPLLMSFTNDHIDCDGNVLRGRDAGGPMAYYVDALEDDDYVIDSATVVEKKRKIDLGR